MKKITCIALLLICSVAVWSLPSSQTGSMVVSWVPGYSSDYPNSSYFLGFNVYYGTTTNISSDVWTQASSTSTNITISGLIRGSTYYVYVSQIGTNTLESDPSNMASYTVPNKPPKVTSISVN